MKMKAFIALSAVLLGFGFALAHHNPDHKALILNKWSKIPVKAFSCNTEELARELWGHIRNNPETPRESGTAFVQSKTKCAVSFAYLKPTRILREGSIKSVPITLIQADARVPGTGEKEAYFVVAVPLQKGRLAFSALAF